MNTEAFDKDYLRELQRDLAAELERRLRAERKIEELHRECDLWAVSRNRWQERVERAEKERARFEALWELELDRAQKAESEGFADKTRVVALERELSHRRETPEGRRIRHSDCPACEQDYETPSTDPEADDGSDGVTESYQARFAWLDALPEIIGLLDMIIKSEPVRRTEGRGVWAFDEDYLRELRSRIAGPDTEEKP